MLTEMTSLIASVDFAVKYSMRKIATYVSFVFIILASNYIGKLIVPTFEVFDGSPNHFEVLYLNLTSFMVRGSLAGLFLMTVCVFIKVSKFVLCNILIGVCLAWFTLGSLRLGSFDMYMMQFQVLPFLLGAAASMLTFEYIGYLTSRCTQKFSSLRSRNSGK